MSNINLSQFVKSNTEEYSHVIVVKYMLTFAISIIVLVLNL